MKEPWLPSTILPSNALILALLLIVLFLLPPLPLHSPSDAFAHTHKEGMIGRLTP